MTSATPKLIRPYHFDTPDAWTPLAARNHGGKRRRRALPPAPVCAMCGPHAPSYVQQTTVTAYICGGCGDIVAEDERVGKRRLHPSSCATPAAPAPSDPPPAEDEPSTPDDPPPAPSPQRRRVSTPDPQDAGRVCVVPLSVKLAPSPPNARGRPP